jgi:hypothetical protein
MLLELVEIVYCFLRWLLGTDVNFISPLNILGNCHRLCRGRLHFDQYQLHDHYYYFLWHYSPARAVASSSTRFLDHTKRRATVGRTPLDEWSVRCRDLYLTTHTHTHQISIHAPGGIRSHDRSRRDLRLRPRGPVWIASYIKKNRVFLQTV